MYNIVWTKQAKKDHKYIVDNALVVIMKIQTLVHAEKYYQKYRDVNKKPHL